MHHWIIYALLCRSTAHAVTPEGQCSSSESYSSPPLIPHSTTAPTVGKLVPLGPLRLLCLRLPQALAITQEKCKTNGYWMVKDEYKKSSDGRVHDSFTISRNYRDLLACAVDSCSARLETMKYDIAQIDFSCMQPNWNLFSDKDFGFIILTTVDHSNLKFEYKRSSDGVIHDAFEIARDLQRPTGDLCLLR
ncbi:unnamed protein product [Arabidopsis arenosa]|uniref:Purple acid phosphatase C-terminal domain-containing protein n=1 Tax=Arabidopsis arenosa TaxID=38785 RepID=A0A8S1ZLF7_ARAAE|nr:unnamed protein product [Arabidopsis arenosa]